MNLWLHEAGNSQRLRRSFMPGIDITDFLPLYRISGSVHRHTVKNYRRLLSSVKFWFDGGGNGRGFRLISIAEININGRKWFVSYL
jgi:hypothetical protein